MGFETEYNWLKEIRERLHSQGNHISMLEGQMLADRMVAEERQKNTDENNKEVKAQLGSLHKMVSNQGATMSAISQGQHSILQTMESDRTTRIETASALEAAEKARRDRNSEPWITPNRVIGLMVMILAIAAYLNRNLG